MVVASLLHVSDLHIEDRDFSNGFSSHTPWLYKALAPLMNGWLGHEYRSLQQLYRFRRQFDFGAEPLLVFTGDLTRCGREKEFTAGDDYLGRTTLDVGHPSQRPIGLNATDWRERGVPGNHDHWPERIFPYTGSSNHGQLERLFGPMPSVTSVNAGSYRLRFIRINGDADVSPHGRHRTFHRGSFISHLDALRENPALSPSCPPKEIRIVLLHHSAQHRGLCLSIDAGARTALDDFMADYQIPVLLTGHLHRPHLSVRPLTQRTSVYEARCGTTALKRRPSQTDFPLIDKARRSLGLKPWNGGVLAQNLLLVHTLHEEASNLYWETQTYGRTPSGTPSKQGFDLWKNLSSTRGLEREHCEARIRLVPDMERIQ